MLIKLVTFDNDRMALTASRRSSSKTDDCTRSHRRSIFKLESLFIKHILPE